MARAEIIDGTATARALRARVADATARLAADHGVVPGLAVVLVGDDPASQVYVRSKSRALAEAGMAAFDHRLAAGTTADQLDQLIGSLNRDPRVSGILVQLPVPPPLEVARLQAAIAPDKDVDGFHVANAGRLAQGWPAPVPCTPLGCLILLRQRFGTGLSGMRALVVGRSNIVGRPVAQLLLNADCTVTVAHSRTADLAAECRRADILVAAAGRPGLIRGDWIKPGATVLDVGVNRLAPAGADPGAKPRLVGDVRFDEAVEVAGAITPVPGGIGPMTIACLLVNTLAAAQRRAGLPPMPEAVP